MKRSRRLSLNQLAPPLLDIAPETGLLTPAAIFDNPGPLEIEVGSGKGQFLVETALAHPEVNYLGIEIDRKHQLYAATRMAKRRLANVRIACTDARLFLRDRTPADCCQALHVYFPDPWWKRRHRKRRVFTEDFARQCERVLAPGGHLYLATDVDEYFQIMLELVAYGDLAFPNRVERRRPGCSFAPIRDQFREKGALERLDRVPSHVPAQKCRRFLATDRGGEVALLTLGGAPGLLYNGPAGAEASFLSEYA